MRSLALDILRRLAAGTSLSGAELAQSCAATPAATGRALARLARAGWVVPEHERVRAGASFDFLDAREIAAALGSRAREVDVRVLDACGSTNTELLGAPLGAQPVLLVAEEQSAGRGRRGRRWHSSLGRGLALSLRRGFAPAPKELAGLSLAAGVAAVRALRALGAADTRLKWPNDLLLGEAKLGGILTETRSQAGRLAVVIGIGINCRAEPELAARLGRRVAALDEAIVPPPSRNIVAAAIAAELLDALDAYAREGLEACRSEWEALDAYRGRRLRVRTADGRVIAGTAEGIAPNGALRLRTRAGLRAVASGRVVLARPA